MSLNFENVILNLKKGDPNAFKQLFDSFYEKLYAFSFNYVKDEYAAEEVVENTMLMVWEKRQNLDAIKDLKSYLYKSVRNASFDYLKKKKKVVSLDIESHDSLFNFEQHIIQEETHKLLIDALNSLPKKCRKVFEMCCIEGLKYKEVADDLQISINTVKSQRSRAIELLKEQLKESHFYLFILNHFLIKD
ncbi:RNA polymerase sigma factor [Snuella sedimenti]|uniref:RNA polymerase sigma-70 factor n=1 Tax=Snuella sedimenti TaxID=2798802 RepID=A0A8J7JC40_9FLAO|nr:RNA polymerase sigma-70 factor [Snuella sedimenti]MBJ6368389.1 RNA polymerase sigma-70 factor [Snuella sedimenti]